MASHSSSLMATAQSCSSYDVFLSFRGEDTRDSFTDHLYTALNHAGIRTFRDDLMDRGKQLNSELTKAIQESVISVIVFSESYASSRWCLDEVMRNIEKHETSSSKHEVIPVFYKVDPSDVGSQIGSFKESFDAYEDEIKAITNLEKKTELVEKVGAWRDSLNRAATLTGLVYNDGYESEFILKIVNDVKKKMDYKVLFSNDKLVGIKDNVADIELWLKEESSDASILLIDGMGGIGKTTLATCIYNSNSPNYQASCFLADINKETSNQPGELRRLQSQILSAILKREETVCSVGEGTVKITKAISNKKVLLILDDVATTEQLDALLGPQSFYPGSKVIITTRHKELSTAFKAHLKVMVRSVGTLCTSEAIKLFSLYAFHQDQPIEPYIGQSKQVVHHCIGLPLALKVLGCSLRGKKIYVWEDTMRKLEAIPHPKIQEVLEISYKTLEDDKDKSLFLHIACFFEGEKEDYIVKLLAHCDLYPVVGISNLIDRCLVYVDEYGRVMMHELIKKMGREVVRRESPNDPGKRSRLWHHEDCINVLQDHDGTEKVKGLMLDMQKFKEAKSTLSSEEYLGKQMLENDANFEIGALEDMKNLMLLKLNYVTFYGECKKLPKKLRLLSWHGFPLKAIPSESCLNKLVVLDMSHSKLIRVWDNFKSIESLEILNLSHSVDLIETPDFGGLPGLESLILEDCSSLTKVHKSITCLEELVLLDLTDCRSLRDLPSLPTSLVSIQMSGCPNLGVLGRVQSMDLTLPFSLLKKANFSYCNLHDDSFPNDMSSLVSLESLNIDGNNVTFLPKCILTLPRIELLYLEYCPQLQSVLGWKKSTCELYIGNNKSLERLELPRENFQVIYHRNCPKLFEVDGVYKIRTIDKVERKIIRYLGLESDAGQGMELGLQVLHEFGIFSTFVSEEQIPSSFMYRERGPGISFEVPWHPNNLITGAFNMCVVLSQSRRHSIGDITFLYATVHNKTKDFLWEYNTRTKQLKDKEYNTWLSLWRCGNGLESGDQIVISIVETTQIVVEECRVSIIYEDDQQLDEETNKVHHVILFDQISWADRMHQDISDYVDSGGRHDFYNDDYIEWV